MIDRPIKSLPEVGSDVVISRVYSRGDVKIADPETTLHLGDIVLAIGKNEALVKLCNALGLESKFDLYKFSDEIISKRMIVTKAKIAGETTTSLNLNRRFGVTITRVIRSDMEFTPNDDFRLQMGDRVVVVGSTESLKEVEKEFGNSLKSLDHPHMMPIFLGIILGVLLGSYPIHLPGTPVPVKLGIAGGPLVIAIVLSRLGSFGSLVWYMPTSANLILRELGIILFLSCVGLKAGDQFINTLVQGDGLYWMAYAALITLLPLLLVGFFARIFLKTNYLSICGFLAGSMTDPPALAFAHHMTNSDEPSVAYATVYPLTMLLRIIAAQVLVFSLAG